MMIKNIVEIIEAFIEKEIEIVSEQEMGHMPTLGEAYECITKDSISKAIPNGINLHVVSGFINGLPEQIDCMLVHGEGVRYGRTDKYFYDIENVLVVFEVKKTLNKLDLVSAYKQLAPISKLAHDKFFEGIDNNNFPDCTDAHRHFSQITGRIAVNSWSELDYCPPKDAMMMSVLTQELLFPVKIIHGYGGYSTEYGLRNAFLDFLEACDPKVDHVSINALPNLIVSERFSLFKTAGLPFVPDCVDDLWPVMASSRDNVIELMVEVIWSKISSFYNRAMPWGEDLNVDSCAALLLAEPLFDNYAQVGGWKYHTREPKEPTLQEARESSEWRPAFFGKSTSSILMHLQYNPHVDTQSDFFKGVSEEAGISTQDLRRDLLSSKIMAEEYGRYIRFILPAVHMLFLKEGGMAASDDIDRLEAWLSKNQIESEGRMVFVNMDRVS
ncbi:DUF6602 domain-containing protein [Vibrio splendidus]